MPIDQIILGLWQASNPITRNPLLDYFNLDDLKLIESLAGSDPFIKGKRNNIRSFIEKLTIDFDPKLKSAFNEYSEAMLYIRLKNKFKLVESIPEGASKTPDFTGNGGSKISRMEFGYGAGSIWNQRDRTVVFTSIKKR